MNELAWGTFQTVATGPTANARRIILAVKWHLAGTATVTRKRGKDGDLVIVSPLPKPGLKRVDKCQTGTTLGNSVDPNTEEDFGR